MRVAEIIDCSHDEINQYADCFESLVYYMDSEQALVREDGALGVIDVAASR
jgi:hypothetical protein